MKQLLALIIFIVVFLQICSGQPPSKDSLSKDEFYNREFKWRISIPPGFDTISTEQYTALKKEGLKDLKKTDIKENDGLLKRICAYKSNIFNYFEANHFSFDKKMPGDFFARRKNDDDEVYAYYKSILFANTKMDTTISDETISNLVFRKFKLQVSLNDKTILNMYVYSRLFADEEFSIVIVYANETKGEMILNAWRNSKFDQN